MKQLRILTAAAAVSGLLLGAAPAMAADLCLQFSGVSCNLSGDLGFFRLMGAKLPTSSKKATRLNGRACGTGTVTGTAVQIPDSGNTVVLDAVFGCDATNGVIHATFSGVTGAVAVGTAGFGSSGYGAFQTNDDCDVTVVDCGASPDL